MMVQKFCSRAARAALLACILPAASLLTAQLPVRSLTPGADFKLEGPKGRADDVPGGRRFRAGGFEDITVRAPIRMPPANSVDNHVRRLIVHFRTSAQGPSLTAAELRSGSQVLYHNADVVLTGDYSKREIATPPRSANVMNVGQRMVGPEVFIRLTIGFPGGFEGSSNTGEFILLGVEAEFLSKPTDVSRTEPSSGPSVPVGQPSAPRAAARGVIYAIMENNDLNWYRHDGVGDASANWTPSKKVGSGWNVKQVFPGGDGVIYAVMPNNDLMWYRHDGRGDGSVRWASSNGMKVGSGWAFKQVFSGGAGVIYALNDGGELLWYRHDGRSDGSSKWAADSGKVINTGWNFKKLFSGGGGVIYAVTDRGDLFWFRHDGRADGSLRWAAPAGRKIGAGFATGHIFSAGGGIIYTINERNDLLWFRHDGISDGSFRWMQVPGTGIVGTGWTVKEIFSGDTLEP